MKVSLGIILLMAVFPSLVLARDARQQARIDFLIHGVETSRGIVSIRNGSEYDGAAAAKHLRMKLDYAGERVKTAEEFVKYCASESTWTQRKYTIRLPGRGRQPKAATYFAGKLREFDAQKN